MEMRVSGMKWLLILVSGLVVFGGTPRSAAAQFTVFDPTNYAQAVLQVRQLVQQSSTLASSLKRLQRVDDFFGEYTAGAAQLRRWLDTGSRVLGRRADRSVLSEDSRAGLNDLFRSAFPEAGSVGFGEVLNSREVGTIRDLAFEAIRGIDKYATELGDARQDLASLTQEFPHHRTQAEADAGQLKLQSLEIHELQNLRDLQMINIQAATTRLLYQREKDRVVDSLTTHALMTDSARWETLRGADAYGRAINAPENVPYLTGSPGASSSSGDYDAVNGAVPASTGVFRRKPGD